MKENEFIQNFINELSNYLENFKEKEKNNFMNIDEISEEYGLNSKSTKNLTHKRNDLLEEYAKKLENDEKLYYVSYKNDFKNTYQILEFDENGKSNSFFLSRDELPENIEIDKVLRKDNDKYIIDNNITESLITQLEDYAKEIANSQNNILNQNRKENALYQVVDHSLNGVYLQNVENKVIFEETNIPKELKEKLGNDYILRYKNGEYVFEEELTEEFFKNLKKT